MTGTEPDAATIDVSIEFDGWLASCSEVEAISERAARTALAKAGSNIPAAGARPIMIGVVLTDDEEQRRLNRAYRGKDAPTNVLAFPLEAPEGTPPNLDAPILLGDVVLAYETVAREAREQEKPLADHLRHLVVHGVLHLLGFDHAEEAEAAAMENLERRILAKLGVPDPYRATMSE